MGFYPNLRIRCEEIACTDIYRGVEVGFEEERWWAFSVADVEVLGIRWKIIFHMQLQCENSILGLDRLNVEMLNKTKSEH